MKLSKNKRAGEYTWWQVVIAITGLLLLGSLSLLYGGAFKGAGTTGKERTCQLSAIANCYGKTPIIGAETFKLDCEMKTITITMKDLEKGMKKARDEINSFNEKFPDQKYSFDSNEDRDLKEWAMNKIVADEMRRCWGNLGSGNLDCLFSNWWSWFGCDEDSDCNSIFDSINIKDAPRFCVRCARIKFDKEVQNAFKGTQIDSLTEWMKKNPVPLMEISYYEYLQDDIRLKESNLLSKGYIYKTDQPYAVVYQKINKHMIQKWFKSKAGGPIVTAIGWKINPLAGVIAHTTGLSEEVANTIAGESTESFDAMILQPYSQLDEYCTRLAD